MSHKPIKLLTDQGHWRNRVNASDLADVQDAILADPEVLALDNSKEGFSERLLSRVLNRFMRINRGRFRRINLMRCFPRPLKGHHLAVLIGINPLQCFPHFPFARHKSIFLWDPWPDAYDSIRCFAREQRLEHIFFTAKQAADHFGETESSFMSHWIPEGVMPSRYRIRDAADRDIDVLQFGRKWDAYHDRIVDHLAATGRTYLYEKIKGEVVFPDREDFIDGLSRSKISICFPSSITHPERAGTMEMMTMRYLQSMASKCLVVGRTPPDLRSLFDYPPIVEIDMDEPARQLDEILDNYESYLPLIERNYREVCEKHHWQNRWKAMRAVLDAG